jgi:hypothetical protein
MYERYQQAGKAYRSYVPYGINSEFIFNYALLKGDTFKSTYRWLFIVSLCTFTVTGSLHPPRNSALRDTTKGTYTFHIIH